MPADELTLELAQQKLVDRLHWFQLDRRDFLKLCGGGLLVCLGGASDKAQEAGGGFREHELPQEVSAWVHIDEGGTITVFTGKVEVGQNIRTSLAQLVAEELRVPFGSITMVMGDTDLTPWDMGTFGSRSTPTMGPQLRTMAAAARQILIEAASQQWNADPATLIAANGKVTNPKTSQSLTYGEITRGKKLMQTVAGDPPLMPASEWKIARRAPPQVRRMQLRDGDTSISVRHHSSRHGVRQNPAPRWIQCHTCLSGQQRGRENACNSDSAGWRFRWRRGRGSMVSGASALNHTGEVECASANFK